MANMSTSTFQKDLESPSLRAFFEHWRSLDSAGGIPPREAFDVIDVPPWILPHLILLDVLDGGRHFRYRVVGTGVVARIGRDFTGETVMTYSACHEDAQVQDGYTAVVETGQPHLYTATLRDVGRDHVTYHRLALPLLGHNGKVGFILACFAFGTTVRNHIDPCEAGAHR